MGVAQHRSVRSHATTPGWDAARVWSRLTALWARALVAEQAHGQGFLWYAVAFGIGAALWRGLDRDVALIVLVLPPVVLALLAWAVSDRAPKWRYLLQLLAIVGAGFVCAQIEVLRKETVLLDNSVVTNITGVVEAREIDFRGHWRYTIAVSQTDDPMLGRPPERVRILARSDHDVAAIGQQISGLARLSPPSGPAMPGTFDFSFNAYFGGIGAFGFFYGPPDNLGDADQRLGVLGTIERQIRLLRETIAFRMRDVMEGDAGAVAAAMTVSDRRAISEETIEAFRVTGLAHILSISGLHMSLAAGIMFQGLRWSLALLPGLVHRHPIKKFAALGAIGSSTFYLAISGGVVSAQRAWIMVVIMLVAVLFDRQALTMRNVAIAAILILIIAPSAVTSPGFQMSFAATAALIAAYGAWSRRQLLRPDIEERSSSSGWGRRLLGFVIAMAMTSLIAGLATGIFSAHHFHRMSGYGLIANIAAMPIISAIVMPAGVLALLCMPFGLDRPFLTLMELGLNGVIAIGHTVASIGGDVATGQVPLVVTALLSASLVILVFTRTAICAAALVPLAAVGLLLMQDDLVRRPVVLISEDGRLVALDAPGGLSTNRARPPSFVFDQWLSATRRATHHPPIITPDNRVGSAGVDDGLRDPDYLQRRRLVRGEIDALNADPQFRCIDDRFCIGRDWRGGLIATIEDLAYIGVACDLADVIITPAAIATPACRSGGLLLTGTMLRQTGSAALYAQRSADRETILATAAQAGDVEGAHDTAPNGNAAGVRIGNGPINYVIETAVGGTVRPWTVHRYYDWRSRSYSAPITPPGT
ncbi:ComEC/Rec2 family competence protein [Pararhizobium haloflavum]|uniref:ComEC/Rec2 family competence protein n=1 Tax=Pararhizobium haloflavum TaxID=2037914 RepID=UPI001AECFAF1|nr:ComEC/Rec2 family competence protein [Pararhizobium haloflavum]